MNDNVNNTDIVFGPVPSRRLGRSIGINNIPVKICSYSCIYCQIGNTNLLSAKRKVFYNPERIYREVLLKVNHLQGINEKIDYLTFVADGEPTLDINLGKSIKLLKPLGIKIAVITNASLLWEEGVRKDLMEADLVSVKIDSVILEIWHKINRPYGRLILENIINGIRELARNYRGKLITETMLVNGINDGIRSLTLTANFIKGINPVKSYVLVPTRPPAEKYVKIPKEEKINRAFQIFNEIIGGVELAISNEGTKFSFSSKSEKELLSILAVHPMRYDAVDEFLNKSGYKWDYINKLIKNNILIKTKYQNNYFLTRKIKIHNDITKLN